MCRSVICSAILLAALFRSPLAAQEQPSFPAPEKEHQWLKQFAGEWETKSQATMAPGQPPIECEGVMNSRMVGGFWVVNEMKGEVMGQSMLGLQTIGYDPDKKKYVGTWVDNMMNHMWQYAGEVDDSGKKLTLEADGPNFMAAGKMTKFRDAYEFKSPDLIEATSSMLGEDGKWTVFMNGEMKRKK